MSKYCAVENQSCIMPRPGDRFHRITNRSGFLYGRGRNSSALDTLKMEVLAPIPIPRDNTATRVNHGFFAKERRANRISCIHVLIWRVMLAQPAWAAYAIGRPAKENGIARSA